MNGVKRAAMNWVAVVPHDSSARTLESARPYKHFERFFVTGMGLIWVSAGLVVFVRIRWISFLYHFFITSQEKAFHFDFQNMREQVTWARSTN